MSYFPHTVTESNITIMVNGRMESIPRTHPAFNALSAHLKLSRHDPDVIMDLVDKRSSVSRLTQGKVKVVGTTVYYNGQIVRDSLANKLIYLLEEGYDATPWAMLLENIMSNPTDHSRESLYTFLDKWDTPITEDGCFVAFKGVTDDYKDCRTGTFDNSPGSVVEMERDDVTADPNVTCSAGLHVCASHYLDSFWGNSNVIAVKVNPRDVVSVPNDYKYSKMRVCRYEVIGDVEDQRHRDFVEKSAIIKSDENYELSRPDGAHLSQYIIDSGWVVDEDKEPDYLDNVVIPGSPEVGVVKHILEVTYSDPSHPEYSDWVNGDIAGQDCSVYVNYIIEFPGSHEESIMVLEGDYEGIRVVYQEEEEYEESEYSVGFEEDEGMYEDDVAEDDEEEEIVFVHNATGQSFSGSALKKIVEDLGQRGTHREYGIPRTTLQDWLSKLK